MSKKISLRSLVDPERLERALYEAIVSSVATRIQAAWQEQHEGEQLDPRAQTLEMRVDSKLVASIATDATAALQRTFDTFMVKL